MTNLNTGKNEPSLLFSPPPRLAGERNPDSVLFDRDALHTVRVTKVSKKGRARLSLRLPTSRSGLIPLDELPKSSTWASRVQTSDRAPAHLLVADPSPAQRLGTWLMLLAAVGALLTALGAMMAMLSR